MQQPSLQRIKQWALLTGIVVLTIIIGLWLYNFLTTGEIDIATNDSSATISIHRIAPNPQSVQDGRVGNHYSMRVSAGTYGVTVENKTYASEQVVTVKALETKHLTINLDRPTATEPVSNRGGAFMAINSQALAFLDQNNNNVYRIDANNIEHLVDVDHGFQAIIWTDPDYGIAQAQDSSLYEIRNDVVTPLSTPYTKGSLTTYGLGPDGTIFLSNGTALYVGTAAEGFRQLYLSPKATHILSIIAASNDNVLLTSIEQGKKEGDLLVVNKNGTIHKEEGEAYNGNWSPSGKYVVISSDGDTEVLDASLKKVISLPTNNVNTPVWIDDSSLMYSITNSVWRFDITSGRATVIASVAAGSNVSQIQPSADKSYVYITVQAPNNTFHLDRIGLKGQKISTAMFGLEVVLPNVVNECSLGYINFTAPTVVAHGPSASRESCLIKTQNYLRLYNVNNSDLTVIFNGSS